MANFQYMKVFKTFLLTVIKGKEGSEEDEYVREKHLYFGPYGLNEEREGQTLHCMLLDFFFGLFLFH